MPPSVGRPRLPEPHHALRGRGRQPLEIGKGVVERLARGLAAAAGRAQDDRLARSASPSPPTCTGSGRVGPVAAHQPVHHLDRHRAQRRQRRDRFLVAAGLGEIDQRRLVEPALAGAAPRRALRRRVVARRGLAPTSSETLASTRRISACVSGLAAASSRCCTTSVALSSRSRNSCGGMSGRSADLLGQHAVLLAPARPARRSRVSENRAPRFSATLRTTSRSPRRTSTSVTGSAIRCGRKWRADAPGSWSWRCRPDRLSASRGDCSSTGPATAMSSSLASRRTTPTGALLDRREPVRQFGARLGLDLLDQAAEDVVEQADMVVVEAARAVEEQRGDALQRLRPPLGRAVLRCTSSSSGISEAGAAISGILQNASKSDGCVGRQIRGGILNEG